MTFRKVFADAVRCRSWRKLGGRQPQSRLEGFESFGHIMVRRVMMDIFERGSPYTDIFFETDHLRHDRHSENAFKHVQSASGTSDSHNSTNAIIVCIEARSRAEYNIP